MLDLSHAVDVFFVVMAISAVVSTIIGALVGWHVLGIVRETHQVIRVVREEGKEVVHRAATAAQEVIEQRVGDINERVKALVATKPRRKPASRTKKSAPVSDTPHS